MTSDLGLLIASLASLALAFLAGFAANEAWREHDAESVIAAVGGVALALAAMCLIP